jgi:hypothetical protein
MGVVEKAGLPLDETHLGKAVGFGLAPEFCFVH